VQNWPSVPSADLRLTNWEATPARDSTIRYGLQILGIQQFTTLTATATSAWNGVLALLL
jgi:hypothetical protein